MITFHTDHLDQVRYKRLIIYILWWLYSNDLKKARKFLDIVDVHIWKKQDANLDFFRHVLSTSGGELNTNIPSGVAGQNRVDLFLHDTRFTSLGFRLRENASRIGHEFAHEAYWLKHGTDRGSWVTVIHKYADQRIVFKFNFYILRSWWKIPITLIDIRSYLQ